MHANPKTEVGAFLEIHREKDSRPAAPSQLVDGGAADGYAQAGCPMARVHVFSLKVGTSHGLWQYKYSGTHDRVMMHGLRHVLDKTCQRLGFDDADRSAVYLCHLSAEPFPGYQLCLAKTRETPDGSSHYRVIQSNIGELTADGLFPSFISTSYLHAWPDRLYFKLERSLAGGIVN
jgi:hypothetical protein